MKAILKEANLTTKPTVFGKNRLLNLLPSSKRNQFISRCDVVELDLGEIICNAGDLIRYVYFPTKGIISREKKIAGSPHIVMNLIGNEGMLNMRLALGVDITPCRAVVQKQVLPYTLMLQIFCFTCNNCLRLIYWLNATLLSPAVSSCRHLHAIFFMC